MNRPISKHAADESRSESADTCTKENGTDKSSSFPVAIVGFAFRFPGDLSDETDFWNALKQKRDLVTRIPEDRWAVDELQHDKRSERGRSITFSAGVLSHIEEFDASFFGISPREAGVLDPQQRLLLELTWETLENAGVPPSSMAGSDCAVYMGISGFDYGMRWMDDLSSITSHTMTGNTLSIAANRISYVFDLHGPSLAVDTACSSSMVALHHACNSLRNGEASAALVGGVNLLLHPHPFVGFTKASMLSSSGRCKPFDASGDGYVRSEGAAVLLLKPMEQALAEGDNIHAVILASGINADGGRKTGITIPSSDGQAELMQEVLSRSGLASRNIDFIEAHGTGTVVGDPVETKAIGMVYGRERAKPLLIGSVKANLGHLESASGMAGLIKTILALKHKALPPAIHLHRPNPQIDFQALNLQLVRKYKTLGSKRKRPLVAGVNSFGFGGANAHVLLQEFPIQEDRAGAPSIESLPPLFLSARTEAALRAMAGRYAELLKDKSPQEFYDISYAAVFRRERMEKRLALHTGKVDSAIDLLNCYANGDIPSRIFIEDQLPQSGGVAFVYSGNGAQWVGMGYALLTESPEFKVILSEIDAIMLPQTGFSLISELEAEGQNSRLDDTRVAQPLLFAIQVGITMLLRQRGIEPAAVAGHSVGEVAAAWAAGALDLQQAIRVICIRSQLQALTRGKGRMAAVGLSAEAAQEIITTSGMGAKVEIAGINSPDNVTLSGSLEGLQCIQSLLESRGVFFRLLDLDYAFHSKRMNAIGGTLVRKLGKLAPAHTQNITIVSTVTGSEIDGSSLNADYWWRNVREPVQFAAAINKIAELGCRIFIEIGPHAILQRYIGECLTAAKIDGRVIPTMHRENSGLQKITEAALRTQLLAERPSLQTCFPFPGRWVRLPNYPWQRERHQVSWTSEGLHLLDRRRVHPLLGWRIPGVDAVWENTLDPIILPWLADHKVGDVIVYPGAAYAEMSLAAAREWLGGEHFMIEQLDIISPMVFDGEHARTIHLFLNPRDGEFHIKSRQRLSHDEWTLHASGRVLETTDKIPAARIDPPAVPVKQIGGTAHYRRALKLGLDYGPTFQGMRDVNVEADRLEAALIYPELLNLNDYLLHPAILDLCFQSLVDFFGEEIDAGQGTALLPVKIGRLNFYSNEKAALLRASLCRRSARSVLADFELVDDQGNLLASVSACRFRAAPLKRHIQQKISNWRIVPRLNPHPLDGMTVTMPPVSDLVQRARVQLDSIKQDRHTLFKETLPLTEALTLSFAWQALQYVQQQKPLEWHQIFDGPQATACARWLASLLSSEGLLGKDSAGQWSAVADTDLPSLEALWQSLLYDSPAHLPQLALLGRAGRQLPALLCGETDALKLLDELKHSPVAEMRYHDDPIYLGMRLALEGTLKSLADSWPVSRRLRILEVTAGSSELPEILTCSLSQDRFDYILALPDEATQARQQAEYQDNTSIVVARYEPATLQLTVDHPLPDTFDVVILRYALHRTSNPSAALIQIRSLLAAGAILLLVEQHSDWSINFLEGIDPGWWRQHDAGSDIPLSPLLPPATWQKLLNDAGFVETETLLEPAAEDLAEGAYLLLAKRSTQDSTLLSEPVAVASWLLVADGFSATLAGQLSNQLRASGQIVAITSRVSADLLQDTDHIVHLSGWNDMPDCAAATVTMLMESVKLIVARSGKTSRLWLITRGGALVTGYPAEAESNPAQSALWGFGRVIMNECPQLSCTLIDLACDLTVNSLSDRLANELLYPDGSNEIVLSVQARYCPVMQEESGEQIRTIKQPEGQRFHLDFHLPGQLRNLVWLPDAERLLSDDEIEVHTRATGLNFRDVMYLMGLLPDEAVENGFAGASLGLEFSGVVSRVGARVKGLLPGDAVMGFGASCFASHVVTRADTVVPMPEDWSFEAAATVPTVFLTVYYALKQLAALQPGERVLIHGAAGGVGVAAIQLARYLGAEIYATAGSDEKRDFVRLLGADHVFDSRSLAFADDILDATAGEGVDVVLNSLAGEAMRRSLAVLKPFGRFLELGKRDFFENTPVGLRPFKNNISYFGIDADQLLTGRPKLAAQLFREVMALFHEQALAPLPYRVFTADRVIDAFRVMQQARHIGKVVVSMADAQPDIEQPSRSAPTICFEKNTTWLVTGGLSGFGLESARWLAERGVDHLVLVGRRGMETPGAREVVKSFADRGVKVIAQACDITSAIAVDTLVEHIRKIFPPLKGVLHSAAVFDDRLIASLDRKNIENVMNAKLLGTWHLHQATLNTPLDYFVLYSSVTTAIGNPGQANYVAANAGLEGITAMRRQAGLPATCIAWGPIGDAGYLVRNEAVKNGLEQRLGKPPLSVAEALAQLDDAFDNETGLAMPANFDWNTLARLLPSAAGNRFDILNRNRQELSQAAESTDIQVLITGKSREEIIEIVRNLVIREVAQTLSINPDRIKPNHSLHDHGMDSLMTVELALGLEQRFCIQLPVMMLNDAPTVHTISARIADKLADKDEVPQAEQSAHWVSEFAHQHGEELLPEDVSALREDVYHLAQEGISLIK
ncbi:SDR family NAD(P)-dependent oxidoreductase [Nitrosomonas sp. HPC101]|uniref:type I polyketide synthase n=1 Tax=Nitrosomonas sp. HPC101 TaxID=1658667 RepID=UPI00136B3683|nr:type I polyketide synthase [Nitrosomonas sp. HPC101]MXS86208.1 SDR family NAD(P)-dependent oxidoreductase [Nitrosomonas sp. HPC101]